jgi:hypothetical protein
VRLREARCQAALRPTVECTFCLEDSQPYGGLDAFCFTSGSNGSGHFALIVQYNAQQGAVNLQTVFIVDEAQFLELVHKQVHAGTRRANHFR